MASYGAEWADRTHYPGARGTPTVHDGRVFVLSGTGGLACFDAASGKRRWAINVLSRFGGRNLRLAAIPVNHGPVPAVAWRVEIDDMGRLLDAAGGLTKLVTLAPERDPGFATTRFLSGSGVVVSAGHCHARHESGQ